MQQENDSMDANQPQSEQALNHIDVKPIAVHIGAEISGVDLSEPLSSGEVAAIRKALLRWKVVFFRGQSLNPSQHIAFARQFGDPTPAHVVFGGDDIFPEIYSVAKFRTANTKRGGAPMRPWTGWHTDITAAINPPFASILRGETVPPYGGDTQWTNLVSAYEALSAPLRTFVDSMIGVHEFDAPSGKSISKNYDDVVKQSKMVAEHPLVRVHPETGERALYVSPAFLKSIAGVTPQESLHLLEMLWEHVVRPEFTVRFRWEPGCIAFWDNRSTAHLAPRDIFDADFDRQFYRVTLNGDVPVGVNGEPSTLISGKPIEAL
jgi:alpha-ketoglutarate-dependent taurine dioxygenase